MTILQWSYIRVKTFCLRHQVQLWALTLLVGMLFVLSHAPYINTFIGFPTSSTTMILLWVAIVGLFHLSDRASFVLALIFFAAAALCIVIEKEYIGQEFGVVVYVLLWIGLVQRILFHAKTKK